MTRAERQHYARVVALGCIVCDSIGYRGTPAEVHHLRDQTGAARKSDYLTSIPVCPVHHRLGDGSARFDGALGYHVAPRTWEARYGTQREFLRRVRALLGIKEAA